MGTPDFAVASLNILVNNGYNIVGVVTAVDKFVGRHRSVLQYSPIKRYALSNGLSVYQPERLEDPIFLKNLKMLAADLQIVVAFRILPKSVWNMPRLGTFNLHASLLPNYRGAAPINWAIINGEIETGVTTFFITCSDVDTGKIIAQKSIFIERTDNAGTVHDKLMFLGAELVIETVKKILNEGTLITISQNEINFPNGQKLKLAPKIFRKTCQVNWNKTTEEIYNFVRGLSPLPGAWAKLTSTKGTSIYLKIFETEKAVCYDYSLPVGCIVSDMKNYINVRTKDSVIGLKNVQLAGKKPMLVSIFLKGNSHIL
jgi:methionyl-tRNA formyltransferase